MKNIKFEKKCNANVLHDELVKGGFNVVGVSGNDKLTIVHLGDGEEKDPSKFVDSHVFVDYPKKKFIDEEKLINKLVEKGVISSISDIELK